VDWPDFILSTLRPFKADWLIDGGWGEINYLVRIDGDLQTRLVLGQNGGLQVEENDEGDEEGFDAGGSIEVGEGEFEPEGLSDADESVEESDDEEDTRHGRNVRLSQVNRRLNLPVRWRTK
jgi:hypothetical protein